MPYSRVLGPFGAPFSRQKTPAAKLEDISTNSLERLANERMKPACPLFRNLATVDAKGRVASRVGKSVQVRPAVKKYYSTTEFNLCILSPHAAQRCSWRGSEQKESVDFAKAANLIRRGIMGIRRGKQTKFRSSSGYMAT